MRLGERIGLEDVVAVARGAPVELGPEAVGRMRASRALVEEKVRAGETVYGVTTGFGALAGTRIDPGEADLLQERIVRSHAAAVGPALSREEARAMLFLRAHVLAMGRSGVRPLLVERMVELLNRDLVPVVPERGSLGASGDLAPLAHLALPLLGRGAFLGPDGAPLPAGPALAAAGLE
ncbi:MAG TPA: aromatic amino acid lyase, partial [Actinomycetota bacterium]|nr:aromatic amino acid lyase [Actinomycetota bacterium]